MRIKILIVQQCLQPFSKKTTFNNGISPFFKNTKNSPDAMARSTMSGGGLGAQETPDLLYQLMFAIGTQGKIIANVPISHPSPLYRRVNGVQVIVSPTHNRKFNPTLIILNACTACLEACWTVRLKTISCGLDDFEKSQNVMNTMHARNQELFALKQWLLHSDKRMASGKGHASCHIPRQVCAFGPHPYNDTDMAESDHIIDKMDYKRTSKRHEDTNHEMLQLVSSVLTLS
jgi:hypothetical protein